MSTGFRSRLRHLRMWSRYSCACNAIQSSFEVPRSLSVSYYFLLLLEVASGWKDGSIWSGLKDSEEGQVLRHVVHLCCDSLVKKNSYRCASFVFHFITMPVCLYGNAIFVHRLRVPSWAITARLRSGVSVRCGLVLGNCCATSTFCRQSGDGWHQQPAKCPRTNVSSALPPSNRWSTPVVWNSKNWPLQESIQWFGLIWKIPAGYSMYLLQAGYTVCFYYLWQKFEHSSCWCVTFVMWVNSTLTVTL